MIPSSSVVRTNWLEKAPDLRKYKDSCVCVVGGNTFSIFIQLLLSKPTELHLNFLGVKLFSTENQQKAGEVNLKLVAMTHGAYMAQLECNCGNLPCGPLDEMNGPVWVTSVFPLLENY